MRVLKTFKYITIKQNGNVFIVTSTGENFFQVQTKNALSAMNIFSTMVLNHNEVTFND